MSNWASNEELAAFSATLGAALQQLRQDRLAAAARASRSQDDLLIRADKNPNSAGARRLFPALPDDARTAFPADTDLVLVWGEGFSFAQLPSNAKIIYLNSWLQPENGHADVFLPISVHDRA